MRRASRWAPILVVPLACGPAIADGGAPIASVGEGAATRTLLMRPAEARVGTVEFTLLGAWPADARLETLAPQASSAVTQPLGAPLASGARAEQVDLDGPGAWAVRVVAASGAPLVEATIEVAPAAPSWLSRLPWAFSWIPMVGLLALRQRAVIYTRRRNRT
jgi:hypothetical protein